MSATYCAVCGGILEEEAMDEDDDVGTPSPQAPSMSLTSSMSLTPSRYRGSGLRQPFKAPSRVASTGNTVSVTPGKKVATSRQQRIENQTTYTMYQCKSFSCGLYWGSDDRHASCRCTYCGGTLIEKVQAKLKHKGLPEQACLVCNCLIRFDSENATVKFCPHDYCEQGEDDDEEQGSLTTNAQQVVSALLKTVQVRRTKYLVNEHLLSETRIDFREAFKQLMPSHKDSTGCWMHRRHVIPQHLLREAWNEAVIRNKPDKKALAKLAMALGMTGEYKNERQLCSAILYRINENPNNLFLAEGPPNSAIGALAHALRDLADKYSKKAPTMSNLTALLGEFELVRSPPKWGKPVGKLVKSIILTYLPVLQSADTLQEAINLVEDLADTANLDLDTTAQGLGLQNGKAISLYQKFQQWVQTQGSWDAFIDLLVEFMSTNMVT
ncbi:hypothetical protein [Myxococcus stipitatus]|uniref:hypothetical protein n=1 Tax=Myxococcus stipitatus TaxID=83455 RepID=UPI0030D417B2